MRSAWPHPSLRRHDPVQVQGFPRRRLDPGSRSLSPVGGAPLGEQGEWRGLGWESNWGARVGAILGRALPAALGAPDPGPLIRDIAGELAELDETMTLSARLDAVIAAMACHGGIRAGRRLGPAEMDALSRQMEATPRAATCGLGPPTFLTLSKAEIETLSGRRQPGSAQHRYPLR